MPPRSRHSAHIPQHSPAAKGKPKIFRNTKPKPPRAPRSGHRHGHRPSHCGPQRRGKNTKNTPLRGPPPPRRAGRGGGGGQRTADSAQRSQKCIHCLLQKQNVKLQKIKKCTKQQNQIVAAGRGAKHSERERESERENESARERAKGRGSAKKQRGPTNRGKANGRCPHRFDHDLNTKPAASPLLGVVLVARSVLSSPRRTRCFFRFRDTETNSKKGALHGLRDAK